MMKCRNSGIGVLRCTCVGMAFDALPCGSDRTFQLAFPNVRQSKRLSHPFRLLSRSICPTPTSFLASETHSAEIGPELPLCRVGGGFKMVG